MTRANIVLLAGIVLVAASNLALPYGGDQSLFALGARHLLADDALYRDFWDLKQPGIFVFFSVARMIFGAGPPAVHLLEAVWFFTLTSALFVAAKRLYPATSMRVTMPLLAAAYAQLVLTADSATQVEALAALPLFLALWLFIEAARGTPRATSLLFGAGLAAGIAVCFKLLFVLVIVPMWLAVLVAGARQSGLRWMRAHPVAGAAAIVDGFSIPVGAALIWCWANGALGDALTTWFVAPAEIVRELPHQSVAVLIVSARGYAILFAPVIVLAAIGLRRLRRDDVLAWGALGWLAGGLITILLQVTSWWPYQWFLLALPTGLLASIGAEALLPRNAATRRYVAVALAVVLVGYPVIRAHEKLTGVARHALAVAGVQRRAFQDDAQPALDRARRAANELPVRGPRDVYVFGNPILYDVLGTLQPIAINGWLPELLTKRTRRAILAQMCAARPRFIYVDDASRHDAALFFGRSPEFVAFLGDHYAMRNAGTGTVYTRINGSGRSCPSRS